MVITRGRWNSASTSMLSVSACHRAITCDEGACRTDIQDTIVAQFFGEDARTKRPVSANIDSSEENNESHNEIIE
jgi:hypothetical protein